MMMTLNNNKSIQAWLRSKNIHVPDDWLEACVEWIDTETQGKLQLPEQLNEAVYEQWLLSDLHELQCPCLPQQLITQRKYQLNGRYALQIDSMVDVSKPYYSQMLKVKGSENDNVNVTAEPTAPWEPKPTRMLMLKLTDGVTEVQGMEYRIIACLNEKIKPGTKVLIQGSVLCRNGVLMLKAENVQLLGGEVDTLIEELTPHCVLQKALKKSMQYSGQEYRQTYDPGPVVNKKSGEKGLKQEVTKNINGNTQRDYGTCSDSRFIKKPTIKMEAHVTNKQMPKNEDEFDDDIALEFLEDMDDTEPVAPPTTQNQSKHPPMCTAGEGRCRNSAPFSSKVLHSENFDAELSYRNHYQVEVGKQVTNNESQIPQSTKWKNASTEADGRVTTASSHIKSSPTCMSNKAQERQLLLTGKLGSLVQGRQSVLKGTDPATAVQEDNLFLEDFGDELDDFDFTSCNSNKPGKPAGSASSCSNEWKKENNFSSTGVQIKTEPCINVNNNLGSSYQKISNNIKTTPKDKKTPTPKLFSSSKSHTIDSYFASHTNSSSTVEEISSSKRTLSRAALIEDFTSIKAPLVGATLSVDALPFTYLSVIKKHLPTNSSLKFKVRGYISTLLDKLDYCQGKMWKLACKINDGSDTLDVNLSNAVLTQLIGFSAADSVEMRKRAQHDHSVREILAEGVQQCQQKLIELLCLMEIQIVPGYQGHPEVTAVSMMSDSDVVSLQKRASDFINGLS